MKSLSKFFRALGLLTVAISGIATSQAQTPPVRIMPLGDSLTAGVSPIPVAGAYRNRLHSILTTAGYNVDFVGTNTDANNPSLPDRNHQGTGGMRIDDLQGGIAGWLNSVEDPDVVLLLAGTNDFSQSFNLGSVQTRMANLIGDIATKRPFAKIIVASLPLRTDDSGKNTQQLGFNSALPGIVNNQVLLGRQVSFVDLQSTLVSGDLTDGVHPNQTGYNKIADAFLPAISNVIAPLGTTNPPAVVRTGPPTTLQSITLTFSKPLADTAASAANFSVNGGVTVSQAVLDAATKRVITLTTSSQSPGTLYTISLSGIRDRTALQNLIAPGSTVAYSTDAQTNGSFEAGLVGWTPTGSVEIKDSADVVPYLPTSGSKLAAFSAGQTAPNGTLSQSFSTTIGVQYVLAFDAGALGATREQRMQINITGGTNLVSQQVAITAPGGLGSNWVSRSYGFIANSTTTTMTFADISASGDGADLTLDNVRLTTQVPRTLTVASAPFNGINVTVSPADLNGASGAPTGFSRQYTDGTTVTLSAPTLSGATAFTKWQRNGVDLTTNSTTTVTMDANYTLNAVYSPTNQVILNGSFENDYANWTQTGSQEIRVGAPYTSTDGAKLVAFNTGNRASGGTLVQSFATTSGETYTLKFDAGAFSFNTSPQTMQVTVVGAGNILNQNISITGLGGGTTRWVPQTFTFVANSTSATLTFRDTSATSNGLDLTLDNVRITGPPLPVNNSPVAVADSYSTNQNTQLVVPNLTGVLANDTDSESNTLNAVIEANPTNGTVTLNSLGGFTYTPTSGFTGADSFSYRANDGTSSSAAATVSITVNGVAIGALVNGGFESGENGWTMTGNRVVFDNSAPYIAFAGNRMLIFNAADRTPNAVVSQTFATAPGQTYSLNFQLGVLGNIEQRIGVAINGNASLAAGTESVFGNSPNVVWAARSVSFTADSNATTITFTDISPSTIGGDVMIDEVSISLDVPNQVPVAVADSYSTSLNTLLTVAMPGLLGNDTDGDMDTLTAMLDVGPANGDLILNANGSFTYDPDPGYTGADSFTYHATDGEDDSNIVTVSLSIGVSQLLVNGSFENGETGWTMTGNRVVYTSDGTYNAFQGSKMAIFNAGESTPNAVVSQSFATVPGETYNLDFHMGILALNSSQQTLRIQVSNTTVPFNVTETLTGNGAGNSVWTPKSYTFVANATTTTLTFTDISTTTGAVDLMLDNVRVTGAGGAPNTAPVAVTDSYSTSQNTPLVVLLANSVLGNDTDAEMNTLTAVLDANATNGNVVLNTNGTFTYTPNNGSSGSDSFTYRANDGIANSNVVAVSITVTPVISGALVNGSFESGYTGWTQTGNQSIQSNLPYVATDGTKLVSFNDGNRAPNGVLSQAFGTVSGQTYTLAFDAGAFAFNTSPQTLQVTVVGAAGLLTQTITINGLGGNGTNRWVPQSFTFIADSPSATLTFRDQSANGNGLDLLLDNVRVTGPPVGNVAPIAVADSYSTGIGATLTVLAPAGVLANDTDVNADILNAALVTTTTNGMLNLNGNGSFTYAPNPGFSGSDSFTYRANDGALNSNTVTVTISVAQPTSQLLVNGSFESDYTGWTNTGNQTIQTTSTFYTPTNGNKLNSFNGVNSTPNGVLSQSFATVTGQTYTLTFDAGVLSFGSFPQVLQVTVAGTSNVLTQTLTLTGFTNGSNRWFPQSFTFIANSTVSTLTFRDQSAFTNGLDLLLDNVRVNGPPGVPNTAPIATGETYSTLQGSPLTVADPGVLGNDTDAEMNTLTASVATTTANGLLTLGQNGGFTYAPAPSFSGQDSFTYRANDGVTNSNLVTVTINVTPVSVGGLTNGSFESGETGWTMTGNRTVFPQETDYLAFQGTNLLVFNAANSTPDAVVSQIFTTTPGQNYTLAFRMGILAGNSAEQKLDVSVVGTASHISVTESLFGNNLGNTVWTAKSYNFTADSNVTTLTFRDLSTATFAVDLLLDDVSVTVPAPNAAPVANANSYSINQDTKLIVAAAGVLANDTDGENDTLSASIDTAPTNGSISLDSDGSFIYTPNVRFSGTDSFTYHANDGTSDSNIATVTINVAAFQILVNGSFEAGESGWTMTGNRVVVENDGSFIAFDGTKLLAFNAGNTTPDATVSQSFTTIPGEEYTLEYNLGTLGNNGIGQSLLVSLTGTATHLSTTETVTGNGSPTTNWSVRSHTFIADSPTTVLTFTDTSSATNLIDLVLDNVTITGPSVGIPNTAPVAVADSYSTAMNTPLTVVLPGVLGNDTDAELSTLLALNASDPANGSVTLATDGSFTYTPDSGFTGTDTFTYQANDGSLASNIVTVSINVTSGFAGIVNGSFESNFTGWTTAGNLGIESGSPFTPTDGSKLAGFNGGNQTPNGVLSQTFATVPGTSYTLAFDLGVLSYNTNSQTMRVAVTGSNSLLNQVISINGLGGGSNRWLPQSFTFVANSTPTTLTFTDQSSTTNLLDLILDNVRVTTNGGGGPNTAPVAGNDSYTATVSTLLTVPLPGVLANDTDAQSNSLTASIVAQATNGTVVLNPNGSFTYNPTTGYTGPDSFTYRANDGALNSNTATVSITVSAGGVNGFTNGSFESDFTNWNVTGNVEIQSSSPYQPTDGSKLASFNAGQTAPNGVLSQTFATTPGATYTLAFDAGTLAFNFSTQRVQVGVTGSGSLLSQSITLPSTNGTTRWSAQSFSFTANSASTTLSFTDTSVSGVGLDLVIDNVRVTFNGSAPVLRTLTVNATPVNAAIIVSPNDSNGNGNGTTNFGRAYAPNTTVNLTAPATTSGVAFVKWQKNGVDLTTNLATSVLMDASYTLTAIYSDPPFSNGSFETGTFAPWVTSGGTANSVKINGELPATNGTKVVEFNSGQSPAGGILAQTFTTTPGVTYNLAFDLGVIAFNTSLQTLQVAVTGSGSLLSQVASINGIGNGTVKWEAKSYTFTANTTSTTLTLTDTSATTNSLDMLLDNVRVTNANSRTLNVNSVGTSNVAVTVSPADNNSAGNGTTQLSRSYNLTTVVSLTAAATGPNGATFVKWVKDGVEHATTPATSVTITADTNLFAIYTGGTFAPLGPNVIVNGSFEFITGHGETATANNWVEANDSTRIEQPGPSFPEYSTDGSNMLSFSVGQTPNDGQIAQAFTTVPGTTYTLQFDSGANGTPLIDQLLDINVFGAGGSSILTRRLVLPGGNAIVKWRPYTYTFTANSTSSTLMFSDGSTTGNLIDIFVDNVRVQAGTLPPAVLTVNTTPAQGKAITVNTPDIAGQGNGTSNFTRIYNPGATVSLVAPHVGFVKWLKNGQWYATNNTITVSMDTSHLMTVVYTDTPVLGPFQNGSFENEFAGWTWAGGPQTVKVKDGLPTTNGLIVVEFNSANSGLDGSITQTFTTIPGNNYSVAFDVGSKAFNNANQTLKVQVTGNNTSLVNQNFTVTGAGNGDVTYFNRTVNFVANSPATTLTFSDQSGTGAGIDLLLDNVILTGVSPPNGNARTLSVNSLGTSNVAITVSPNDNNAVGNGSTQLSRTFDLGTNVSLTAAATGPNGATFVKWVKDGVDHATTRATNVTITADTNLFAIYSGGTFAPLGPNVIQNGSFEFITGHGETATANNWVEANDSTRIEQPGAAYPEYSTDGNNMLSFSVGGTPNNGQIAQAFATVPGTTYTLQFDSGANGTPVVNQLLDINVFGANGASILTHRLTLPGGNAIVKWSPYVFTFTANSTSSTLMFSDGSTTGNAIDIFVDNVRVRAGTLPPAVLTVNTTPAQGKAITVNTSDIAGQANGTSNFTRIYNPGATVTLVAPHVGFVKWLKNGQWYATNNTITVSMDTSHVMTVVYTATPVLGPFQNGSFENEFAGWTWAGGPQTVKVKDGLPTTDGLIVVEFNSANSGLDGSITQTFTTVPGQPYSVAFDVGSKAFNNANQTLKVQVTGNNTSLVNQNFTVTGAGNGDVTYFNRTVNFTANSGVTTLTFSDQSSTGAGLDLLLDNVILTGPSPPAPSFAPEPNALVVGPPPEIPAPSLSTVSPGNLAIAMNATEPGTYTLQCSEDLSKWEDIGEGEVVTEPRALQFFNAPPAHKTKFFYRVKVDKP